MIKATIKKIKENPIVRSSVAIAIITVAAKILGYAEKLTLAYFFGTSYQVDVYNVTVTIVLSVFILFREIIEPGFLNSFLKAKNNKDEKSAWNLLNTFIVYIFIITLLLSLFVYFNPAGIIDLFAPGFKDQKKELAITLIQLAFPACIFLSVSTVTNITLNGLKRFALPASGELVFKAFIILCLLFLYRYWGIMAAVAGLLLGSFFKLGTHLLALYKQLSFKPRPGQSYYLKNAWNLSWPLLIGVLFSQAGNLADNVFASSQQEGAISALSYANKLIEFPVLIFPYILSVVIFPYFAELSISKEKEKLAGLLSQSLSWITVIFVPLAVFYFISCREIVDLVFRRGAFNDHSVLLTTTPLRYYSIGMIFFAIETVLVIFYFANANTKVPIFTGIVCVVEKIILSYVLIKVMGYAGIALAHVISKATKNIILLLLLQRSISIQLHVVAVFMGKVIVACILAAIAVLFVKDFIQYASDTSLIKKLLFLGATFGAGTAIYIVSLFMMKFRISR